MGTEVHAQQKSDGYRYRIWSTNVDAYITPELTEREVVTLLIYRELGSALQSFGLGIRGRLERARDKGTSSFIGDRNPDGSWRQQREEWGEDDPHASYSLPVPDEMVKEDPIEGTPFTVNGVGFRVHLEVTEVPVHVRVIDEGEDK